MPGFDDVTSLRSRPPGTGEPPTRIVVLPQPALLWVILLFAAAAGLPRGFVHEEETHTATALRLAATPSALFCGKALYSASLLLALEALLAPLYVAVMQLPIARPALLVAALACGGLGLAIASTLLAAIVAQAQGRAALFPILAFPVLLLVTGFFERGELASARALLGRRRAPGVAIR